MQNIHLEMCMWNDVFQLYYSQWLNIELSVFIIAVNFQWINDWMMQITSFKSMRDENIQTNVFQYLAFRSSSSFPTHGVLWPT